MDVEKGYHHTIGSKTGSCGNSLNHSCMPTAATNSESVELLSTTSLKVSNHVLTDGNKESAQAQKLHEEDSLGNDISSALEVLYFKLISDADDQSIIRFFSKSVFS